MAAMSEDNDPYSDGDAKKPEDTESKGDDASETVIPRSICAGHSFDVGDKVTLEITGIHDKEYSVKYASDKDKDGDVPHGTSDESDEPEAAPQGDGDYD